MLEIKTDSYCIASQENYDFLLSEGFTFQNDFSSKILYILLFSDKTAYCNYVNWPSAYAFVNLEKYIVPKEKEIVKKKLKDLSDDELHRYITTDHDLWDTYILFKFNRHLIEASAVYEKVIEHRSLYQL